MGLFLLGRSRCTFAGCTNLGGCDVVFSSRSLLRFLRGGVLFRSVAFVCLRLGRIGSGLIFAFAVGRFALRCTTSLLTFLACFGAFVFAVFALGVAFCSVFVLLFTARFGVFALSVFVFSIFFLTVGSFVVALFSAFLFAAAFVARIVFAGGGAFALFLGDFRFDLVYLGHGEKLFGAHGRTLFFGAEDAVEELRFAAQFGECVLGCGLVTLFFRVAHTFSGVESFDDDGGEERGAVGFVGIGGAVLEFESDAVFLAPLQKLTFEVDFFACHGFEVEDGTDDALLNEAEGVAESSVEIDGAHEGFEGVPAEVGVVGAAVGLALDEAIDVELFGQFAE